MHFEMYLFEIGSIFLKHPVLPSTAEGLACVGPYRQHYGCCILHQSPGWAALDGRKVSLSESILHSGAYKHGRHPVKAGAEARGMATPPISSRVHMAKVRQGKGGSFCL